MRIEVTADDIAAGSRQACFDCPLALAIDRATGGRGWGVDETHAFLGGERRAVSLPGKARAFVAAFDQGFPVEPFAFNLRI